MPSVRLAVLLASAAASLALLPAASARHPRPDRRLPMGPDQRWPVRFELNRGQSPRPAAFVSASGAGLWRFRLGGVAIDAEAGPGAGGPIQMTWLRSSPLRLEPAEPLPLRRHVLLRSGAAASPRRIPTFGTLRYRRVYPGVDAIFHGVGRNIVQDLHLEPGADPGLVRLHFEGATATASAATGAVHVQADDGRLALELLPPQAYQDGRQGRVPVSVRYRVASNRREMGFGLGAYDRAAPLVLQGVGGPLRRAP